MEAKEIYRHAVRGEWKKVRGLPYRAVQLDVFTLEMEFGSWDFSCEWRI